MSLYEITEALTKRLRLGLTVTDDDADRLVDDSTLAEYAERELANLPPHQFLSDVIERMTQLEAGDAAKAIYARNINGAVIWNTFRHGLRRAVVADVVYEANRRADEAEARYG